MGQRMPSFITDLFDRGYYEEVLNKGSLLAEKVTAAEAESLMEAALLMRRPDEALRWWTVGGGAQGGAVDFHWVLKRLRLWHHEVDLQLQIIGAIPKPRYQKWAAALAQHVLTLHPGDPRPLALLHQAGIATAPLEALAPCRRPILASPGSSGLTWLTNALIEAGVRAENALPLFFAKCCNMDGNIELYENITAETGVGEQFFYPALFWKQHFLFRNDIVVTTGHRLYPQEAVAGRDLLLMMRDPRDMIWSAYHIYRKDGEDFAAFAARRVRYWNAWVDLHLGYGERTGVVWFEDYKRDARKTFEAALRFLAVEIDAAAVIAALERSDFTQAALTERAYRRRYGNAPLPAPLARSGKAGEHRRLPEHAQAFDRIERDTADRLARLRALSLPL